MKATEAKFLEFLKKSPQFVIPIYQRTYSWTERECRQLWEDILRTGSKDAIGAHFVGSIVYIEKGLYQIISQPSLLVIDGQQRLTTVMLILEALARRVGDGEPVDGFSAKKLRSYYLLNPLEEGERGFKLLLTQTDKQSMLALMQQKPQPAEPSLRITENFAFFEEWVQGLGADLTPLCKGLAKLMIVDIALSRDQDNPQLIFESMNSTGRELSQADLIRNLILIGLDTAQQTRLYEDHWRPMEVAFGQDALQHAHFDGFMRHYLTLKTDGKIPNVRAVYEEFKGHACALEMAGTGVDALVADIHAYAGYYCAMALDKEPDKELALAFRDLRELKVDVAFPFLLELYDDYAHDRLSKDDFVRAVRLVEAYVFRRAVCAIPTNSLNKTFATFGRVLKKDRYIKSIQAHLLTMPSYRRFPSDEEFKCTLSARDLYNFPRRSYWLRRLENYERKERVPVDEYTIEHILPQNENLSTTWREALGPEWQRVQETWLHTLGNLTLTGYNTEYSDRPFAEKRNMPGGFKESPLRLNEGLGALDTWNEAAIQQRAKELAAKAVRVWARPTMPADVLETYRPKTERRPGGYTLDDHAHLAAGSFRRPLFESFRKAVLALDPCVSEEVLKRYVAYKAETNFVDLEPQKSCLRLSLNLHFHELHDPRGLAKDVTNISRWGNGDAEVRLTAPEELPYVMGLVRQAFEKQMGNGEAEAMITDLADLKPYPAMKPSGVEWLGEMPEHWELRRLAQIGRLSKGNGGNKDDEVPMGVPCVRYGDLYTTHTYFIRKSRSFVSQSTAEGYTPIKFGDVLFAASGETFDEIGKSAVNLMQSEGCCGGDVILFRPERRLEARYMGYATDCRPAAAQKATMGRGITVKHIYGDQLKYLTLAVPPLPEQAIIVRYLDHADRRIQRYIRAKQKLVTLLEEQKQALIHQAVTGQIDVRTGQPYPAYKPSGVEWLGEVPVHWEVMRSRLLFNEVNVRSTTGKETHMSMSQTVGLVPSHMVERTLTSESYVGGKLCEKGDLVLNRLKAHLSVFALAKQSGVISPDYSVFRKRSSEEMGYFEQVFLLPALRSELRIRVKGIVEGFWRLYTDDLFDIRLPVPPVSEQKKIVDVLQGTSASIDTAINRARRQIELLQEYRTRLIADVVTGKLDVREAAAGLLEVDPLADEFDALTEAPETGVMELEDATESPEELAMGDGHNTSPGTRSKGYRWCVQGSD